MKGRTVSNFDSACKIVSDALEEMMECTGSTNPVYEESRNRIAYETAEELERQGLLAEDIL